MPSISPVAGAESLVNFRRSIWNYIDRAVWTLDEADKLEPIKKFPTRIGVDPQAAYLKHICDLITSDPLVAIVKHRRMLITWLCCAIASGEAMFFEGQHIAMVSKKEVDSDDLIRRAFFIYNNIPKEVLPFKPEARYKYTELSFPEIDSKIHGYAQGADQLRQYTCSRVFCDEIAFWPHARQTFTALKPTIEGGGKIVLLSTRHDGFFRELVEDQF